MLAVPWVKAILRGQTVLARVNESGAFVSEGGRVEIRYKAGAAKAYRAGERKLERVAGTPLLPDDTCPAGEPAPSKAERSAGRKATAAARATAPGAVPAGAWTVYADGACSGNPGPAGLGIVLVAPSGDVHEGYEYLGVGTNNIAELTGILHAAELLPPGTPAVVHTDSQYSIGVLSKGWKAKANQDLIGRVKDALATQKRFRLVYVPGHAGVPLNERADALAREAVRTRASKLPSAI
jgi:ribonuclease HI